MRCGRRWCLCRSICLSKNMWWFIRLSFGIGSSNHSIERMTNMNCHLKRGRKSSKISHSIASIITLTEYRCAVGRIAHWQGWHSLISKLTVHAGDLDEYRRDVSSAIRRIFASRRLLMVREPATAIITPTMPTTAREMINGSMVRTVALSNDSAPQVISAVKEIRIQDVDTTKTTFIDPYSWYLRVILLIKISYSSGRMIPFNCRGYFDSNSWSKQPPPEKVKLQITPSYQKQSPTLFHWHIDWIRACWTCSHLSSLNDSSVRIP